MTDNTARIAALSEALARANDARVMASTDVWARAWEGFERVLIDRFLECEEADDTKRFRLQIAIEAARHARRAVEHDARTQEGLEKELALLEGRKPRAIA